MLLGTGKEKKQGKKKAAYKAITLVLHMKNIISVIFIASATCVSRYGPESGYSTANVASL